MQGNSLNHHQLLGNYPTVTIKTLLSLALLSQMEATQLQPGQMTWPRHPSHVAAHLKGWHLERERRKHGPLYGIKIQAVATVETVVQHHHARSCLARER